MVSNCPAIIFAAVLCLAAARPVQADCRGHDLFPVLKSQAPAAFASIEAAAVPCPLVMANYFAFPAKRGPTPIYSAHSIWLTHVLPDFRLRF